MRRQTRHQKEALTRRWRERLPRALERDRRRAVVTQRHPRHVAFSEFLGDGGLLQGIHVLQNAIQFRDEPGEPRVVDCQARELRDMKHIFVGDRHLLPPAFEFGLRQHQSLPADLFVFEINTHLQVTPAAGEFCDRARSELRVTHLLTDGEHRRIL